MPDVKYHRKGRVGYITFDRPAKLNALTDDGINDFVNAFREFEADDGAFVGIISGEGRAFCVGADLQARILDSVSAGLKGYHRASFDEIFAQSPTMKPLISAVHGYVLGKALSAAFHSEYVVAADDTQFQLTELNFNLAAASYWALVAFRTNDAFAMDIGMSGRYWSAQESLDNHLVNRVVPVGQQLAAAEEFAELLAQGPPMAIRSSVRMRRAMLAEFVAKAGAMTDRYRFDLTHDYAEGVKAKIEKRAPRFIGS